MEKVDIGHEIERLLNYGLYKSLLNPLDIPLIRNELMDLLKTPEAYRADVPMEEFNNPGDILNNMLVYCFEAGLLPDNTITQRDILTAKIMGKITPSPRDINKKFSAYYGNSPMEATDYLYALCCDINYIHADRAKKNIYWGGDEEYGSVEITINFQCPEKTNSEIEARKNEKKPGYPECELCVENVGFPGNLWFNPGQNMRVVPITLLSKLFYFEYPPEQHYNERCFLVAEQHKPLEITKSTFDILLDFVDKFPHYFMGVDAPLPSFSNCGTASAHEHYQGGCFVMPIEFAEVSARFRHSDFEHVDAGILNWPISTIRLESDEAEHLSQAAKKIYDFWSTFTDEEAGIYASGTNGQAETKQSAAAGVVRKNARGCFEIDLFLRNTAFAPREFSRLADVNVGITESMGLAVYPEALDGQLLHIMNNLMTGKKIYGSSSKDPSGHTEWVNKLVSKYGMLDSFQEAKNVVFYESARKFTQSLKDCGVFNNTEEGVSRFKRFMTAIGFTEVEYCSKRVMQND